MKKQLIEAHMVKDCITADNKIYVDNSMVLTPGARDILSAQRIEVIRVTQVKKEENNFSLSVCLPSKDYITANVGEKGLSVFTKNLSTMLKQKCGITNPKELEEYTHKAIALIKKTL